MTVASIVQEYPQFVANQVLTQDQLNQMRIYLDSQNRLTRVKLVGMGIICGLHVQTSTSGLYTTVTITEGYGVTSDGWIIHIPERTLAHKRAYVDPDVNEDFDSTPPSYIPFQVGYNKSSGTIPVNEADRAQIPIQELLTDSDAINPTTRLTNANLQGKVILLYLELKETELKSCFTTDCNNKGETVTLDVKVLVASQNERFLPAERCNELTTLQPIPRFYAGLQLTAGKQVHEVNDANEITDSYNHISDYLKTNIGDLAFDLLNNNKSFFDLFEEESRITGFKAKLNSIYASSNFNQYRYDFFKDLTKSYNELVQALCKIVAPCHNPEYFPRHLVLRDFNGSGLIKTDGVRHPFYPSPVRNVMDNDFNKVRSLFIRLLDLATHYNERSLSEERSIKITPSALEGQPLEEHSIPFYYDKDSIASSWLLNACCALPSLSAVANTMQIARSGYTNYFQNPLHYNLSEHQRFLIDGHLGGNFKAAITDIQALRALHHLDFQIKALPLVAPAIIATPTRGMTEQYVRINTAWESLYNLVESGAGGTDAYQVELNKIADQYTALKFEQENWCGNRQNLHFDCDASALQADYLQLRAAFLCHLNKCKPLLRSGFKIEAEDSNGSSNIAYNPVSFCGDFGVLKPGIISTEDDAPGRLILLTPQSVSVQSKPYIDFDRQEYYNQAAILEDGTSKYCNLQQMNLEFDLNPFQLENVITKVSFVCLLKGKIDNLTFNDLPISPTVFRQYVDQERSEMIPNYFFQVESLNSDEVRVTLDGPAFTSVTIGGDDIIIKEYCFAGESRTPRITSTTGGTSLEVATIPNSFLEVRYERIKMLSNLMEAMLPKDVRCFNYDVLRLAIKDVMNLATEAKLIHAFLFNSIQGRFAPFRFYPWWNDFSNCLDALSNNCFYGQFANLFATLQTIQPSQPMTFGSFSKKYPGAIHRQGVNKGGTFLMVYTDDSRPNIVADFSLDHYVEEDCCSCKIDPNEILLPPIGNTDYRILKTETERTDIDMDIFVLDNDFNLNGLNENLKITLQSTSSFKGASLTVVNDKYIRYSRADAGTDLDHFTYFVQNDHGIDSAEVYILVLEEKEETGDGEPPKGTGQVIGQVVDARTFDPIFDAEIIFSDADGTTFSDFTDKNGDFNIENTPIGQFDVFVTKSGYSTYKDVIGIPPDLGIDMGQIQLVFFGLTDRFGTNVSKVKAVKELLGSQPAFNAAENFVEKTVQDEELSITKITAAFKKDFTVVKKAHDNAADSKVQKAAKDTMVAMVHSYMDRLVFEKPAKPSITALRALDRALNQFVDSDIATAPILRNWKLSELKKAVDGEMAAIDGIRAQFNT